MTANLKKFTSQRRLYFSNFLFGNKVFIAARVTTLHVQTCDNVRVQSATQWTVSVHTLNMSKPVIAFVFKVPRNGLLQYMLYTCPNL